MKKNQTRSSQVSLLVLAIYLMVSPNVHISLKQSSTLLGDGSKANSFQVEIKKEEFNSSGLRTK